MMNRREFVKISTAAAGGLSGVNLISSCVGTYNPKIIDAIWNEKFIFDSKDETERLRQLVRCAVMAPSGHNTQPWHFKINEGRIEIIPDFSRRLPIADRNNRELFISLGCCLENILISAPMFGYAADYEIGKMDNTTITIHLSSKKIEPNNADFDAMLKRQTTRNEYRGGTLPKDFISDLQLDTSKITAYKFIDDQDSYSNLMNYMKEGNRLLYGNDDFLKELKEWIRFSDSDAENKLDGIYARALGNPSTAEWFGRMSFNLTVTPETQNKEDEKLINSSSGVLMLFSRDSAEDWIETGRQLEQTLTKITRMKLKYAFHNQPCQAEALRKDFARDYGNKGLLPQAILRIGYSDIMPRSPRRKIKDVII